MCEIFNRCFYTKGNIARHMLKTHSHVLTENKDIIQCKQVTIQPQESWLSKSLQNLDDLLSTIQTSILVSKDDEMKL